MYDCSFLVNRVSIEHRRHVDVALAECKHSKVQTQQRSTKA